MSLNYHIIIPARFNSTRFPGKLLCELNGMTVLQRVYEQALQAQASSIVIATDDSRIAEQAKNFGAPVVMTRTSHESGTERLAEVVEKGAYAAEDIIVNVQADEPFIAPELIYQVANELTKTSAPVATLCWPIESLEMFTNPHVVKVVYSSQGYALYFSRSPIPAHRDAQLSYDHAFRHIGLYAYRASFLLDFITWPSCPLETLEALEQLRILWAGVKIKLAKASVRPMQDINTLEDLNKARLICALPTL